MNIKLIRVKRKGKIVTIKYSLDDVFCTQHWIIFLLMSDFQIKTKHNKNYRKNEDEILRVLYAYWGRKDEDNV